MLPLKLYVRAVQALLLERTSASTDTLCRLYKQQLQAITKQVTYTEHCLNTATEAGQVSNSSSKAA